MTSWLHILLFILYLLHDIRNFEGVPEGTHTYMYIYVWMYVKSCMYRRYVMYVCMYVLYVCMNVWMYVQHTYMNFYRILSPSCSRLETTTVPPVPSKVELNRRRWRWEEMKMGWRWIRQVAGAIGTGVLTIRYQSVHGILICFKNETRQCAQMHAVHSLLVPPIHLNRHFFLPHSVSCPYTIPQEELRPVTFSKQTATFAATPKLALQKQHILSDGLRFQNSFLTEFLYHPPMNNQRKNSSSCSLVE